MKSWRRPWQATGDKSNVGHPRGASRFIRVIPPSATPSTGHRTPLHDRRFAAPYGLRYAAVSPLSTGPQQALRKLHGRFGDLAVINPSAANSALVNHDKGEPDELPHEDHSARPNNGPAGDPR